MDRAWAEDQGVVVSWPAPKEGSTICERFDLDGRGGLIKHGKLVPEIDAADPDEPFVDKHPCDRVIRRRFKAPSVTFGEPDIEIVQRRGSSDKTRGAFVATEQNLSISHGIHFIGREILTLG